MTNPIAVIPIAVIKAHIPSITTKVETEELFSDAWTDGEYIGDHRECACGVMLDGYYAYVDHLIGVLGGQPFLGA